MDDPRSWATGLKVVIGSTGFAVLVYLLKVLLDFWPNLKKQAIESKAAEQAVADKITEQMNIQFDRMAEQYNEMAVKYNDLNEKYSELVKENTKNEVKLIRLNEDITALRLTLDKERERAIYAEQRADKAEQQVSKLTNRLSHYMSQV